MKKPTPGNQTEWFIKKQVRQILIDTGWEFWMPSANAYSRSGQSDFLCVKFPVMFMAIETKYKSAPTQPQLEFLKMIWEAAFYAFIVDETNIEEFKRILTREHEKREGVLFDYQTLAKWKVTEHDNPPTNQERSTEAARSITSAVDLSWTEPTNRRRRG